MTQFQKNSDRRACKHCVRVLIRDKPIITNRLTEFSFQKVFLLFYKEMSAPEK